ncbi:MAG: hypothetical protein RLN89_04405 [Parvibaculum sp.]
MNKAETLKSFLGTLPPRAAVKLLDAIEKGALPAKALGLSMEEIRESLTTKVKAIAEDREGDEKPQRLFSEPFEDFLFDGERTEKVPGAIPRSSLAPIWHWLKFDLMPDALPDMVERIYTHLENEDEEALASAVTVMQEAAARAMQSALSGSRGDIVHADKLVKKLGDYNIIEDAHEIADVLSILDDIKTMQHRVPRHISAFDDRMVSDVRDLYDDLFARDPDRAIYLALAVMGRLQFPWHILRLARKVAQRSDDTMISRTDFSILGERLIRRLEVISGCFKDLRPGLSDLRELHLLIVEFSELSHGITKEIELLRIGNWGQRLLKGRNTISTAINDEFARYLKDLSLALPLQRVGGFGRSGPRRVDVSHAPTVERVERVMRELTFMKEIESHAQAIGVKNVYDKTQPEMQAYMEMYEDALIEELRICDPSAHENAQAYLEAAANIMAFVVGDEAAAILRKRGRVALQAPA